MPSANVEISGASILVDGKPTQIRSGAMHYFRIPPAYWRDRLVKLRQCGLNTVETYLAWNLHEPRPGVFDFSGGLDVAAFLRLARELGLYAIVRPGPYICSELDFGGIPSWLLAEPHARIRCMEPTWIAAVERYFAAVLPRLRDLQRTADGPVLMMQVENEYGSAANDRSYLRHLYKLLRDGGIDIPLFVSDWSAPEVWADGALPETLLAANCRDHPGRYLDVIRSLRPDVPEIVMELWSGVSHKWTQPGWLRHDVDAVARDIEELMARGASFNLYMFHGGTSFGFLPGAVDDGQGFLPYVNSYDTDAPLDEAGNPTPKYAAIQAVIRRHCPSAVDEWALPVPRPAVGYGRIALDGYAPLFASLDDLSEALASVTPEPMERFGQDYGFILYSTDLGHLPDGRLYTLRLENLADRAQVFVDGAPYGTLYRNDGEPALVIPRGRLDILVENMGRVNANTGLQARFEKGISAATVDRHRLFHWTVRRLPLNDLSRLRFREGEPTAATGPVFWRGSFTVESIADTWLRVPFGEKGVVFLNGFNLGRYWRAGPQYALYAPAPLLREGRNELIVFEQHGLREYFAESINHPDHAPDIVLPL